MLTKIQKVLQTYIDNKDIPIILAISGGVDSVVLLKILLTLYKSSSIHLIHFNYNKHSLSRESEHLVYKLSKKYKCNYKCYNIDVDNVNFEHKARKSRYELLELYSKKYSSNIILTAHHKNDQMETLIMQDCNNAPWVSFLGIREKFANIIRPMLNVSKNDIYEFARINNLVWIEDDTNNNLIFKRNITRFKINNNFYSNQYLSELLQTQKKSCLKDGII